MPLLNELIGAFKTIKIAAKYVIVNSVSRKRDMESQQKNYVQGTTKARIMNIGKLDESYSVNAPVLIGGGSKVDGRTLLNDQITNALDRANRTLPILTSASVDIRDEATVQITLRGDGSPLSSIFELASEDASNITDGTDTDLLNPNVNMPTRVARFFDFRVDLAGFKYFVEEASIKVQIGLSEKTYMAGNVGYTGDNQYPAQIAGDVDTLTAAQIAQNAFGRQYVFFGVNRVTIGGSGKASVYFVGEGNAENINYNLNGATGDVTLQRPGAGITVSTPFSIEVFEADSSTTTGEWRDLLSDANGDPIVDLSNAIVKSTNLTISAEIISVDFEFECYVI